MLQKTKAISLHYIRYKETSIIARLYTEEFGLQSFIVNGVRTVKSKMPAGLFQPFQLLDLVQYFNEKKDLHRLVEIKPALALVELPFHPAKAAMAIFSAELVSKVVREGQTNPVLFHLVWNWILELDHQKSGYESNHIGLICKLLQPLGLTPEKWVDIFENGKLPEGLSQNDCNIFFSKMCGLDSQPVLIGNATKQTILDSLIAYMQKHLDGLGSLNSISILRDVFR